jgi:pimeloyl-ACP methyl ester carboxylesterase
MTFVDIDRIATALVTPDRRALRDSSVRWESRRTLVTRCGSIAYWTSGSGPAVLLVHGWEGSHVDLDAFVAPLLARGFGVVTLDLPAHGESSGATASTPDCGEVLAALGLEIGPLAGAIAHSAGALTVVAALDRGLRTRCVVLIGTPEGYERYVRWFADEQRVDGDALIAALAGRGIDVRALGLSNGVGKLDLPAMIVHSLDDDVCEVRGARAVAAAWRGSEFVEVDGLGHKRILRDPAVIEHIVEFVAAHTGYR